MQTPPSPSPPFSPLPDSPPPLLRFLSPLSCPPPPFFTTLLHFSLPLLSHPTSIKLKYREVKIIETINKYGHVGQTNINDMACVRVYSKH